MNAHSPINKQDCALVLLAHGSTRNGQSSDPAWACREQLRKSGTFGAVHCAFWKEEPSFRQLWPMVEKETVYLVPLFISQGYFTNRVIPRELELDGPFTKRNGRVVRYCEPVGLHPSMTGILAEGATDCLSGVDDPEDSSLIIVGHGTELDENSSRAVRSQVERLLDTDIPFSEVIDAYLDESPPVSSWRELTNCRNVVVLPFFVSDGLHTSKDIPRMLGISDRFTGFAGGPVAFDMDDRQLIYSPAIGNHPSMSRVVVDQVTSFDERYGDG